MEREVLKVLFKKYHDGTATEEEKALLESWYLQHNEHPIDLAPQRIKAIGKQIFRQLPENHPEFIKIGLWLAVAAITIGLLVTVTLKYFHLKIGPTPVPYAYDIPPGTNKAMLTLANGKKIILNDAANGPLSGQPGIKITKTANGQLVYAVGNGNENPDNLQLNNITTPNGGQWQVLLPDGTKVWLNAASSFTYPASFAKQNERTVQLSGEAYFEVAKDKAHPFIVKTGQQEVRVLGTHFNISSYKDESEVKTTLLEGSVKITNPTSRITKVLVPGQQSVLFNNTLAVNAADTEQAVAWKNGYFRFNNESIQSIMRKLARWYDIDVRYDSSVSTEGLNGKVSRYKNISQVLKALEATKTVHFKMEGRSVKVMR